MDEAQWRRMDDPITSSRFRSEAAPPGFSSAFEALFRAAPSPFLVLTPPDYTIIAVNDAYLAATMTERAAIVGRGLFEVFPAPNDEPAADGPRKLRASLERVVATRRTDEMTVTHYDIPRPAALGGGFEERWWSPRNAPVLGENGEVVCIIHHVEDVTARVRAAEALRASETKYQELFDSIDEGFAVFDMIYDVDGTPVDFRYVETNPAFERQAGRRPRPGQTMRELFPEAKDMWLSDYAEVARNARPKRFVDRIAELDRWFDVFVFPAAGPSERLAALFRDVTEQKRAEGALRESEQRLLAAVGERDALLKEVHHRVKNNLQVITSLLEMQARQIDDLESFHLFMETRNRVGAIASIHELLYRAGSLSEIDLVAWVRQLAEYLVSFYRIQDRVKVTVEGDHVVIELDRAVPLGLLFNELISNVCKHAFPLPRRGELMIHLGFEGESIRAELLDTGVGLAPEVDLENPSTLGLQIVQTLASQLHGDLSISSASGTRVLFLIPRRA